MLQLLVRVRNRLTFTHNRGTIKLPLAGRERGVADSVVNFRRVRLIWERGIGGRIYRPN